MARYGITRRFTAAFFMSLGIVAVLALWFAWPAKVHAQSDLCVPAERFVEALAAQPTVEFIELLGEARAVQYLEAATGNPIPSDVNAILYIVEEGDAAIVPIIDGEACASYGVIRIQPEAHDRGMSAVYGEPV